MILYNSNWKSEDVADAPEVDSRIVCYEVVDLHAGCLIQERRALIEVHLLNERLRDIRRGIIWDKNGFWIDQRN